MVTAGISAPPIVAPGTVTASAWTAGIVSALISCPPPEQEVGSASAGGAELSWTGGLTGAVCRGCASPPQAAISSTPARASGNPTDPTILKWRMGQEPIWVDPGLSGL